MEFYFSDANITRDKFLLKHVRRNKEGFVSLKLVASFKRVKHLTKDWRQASFSALSNYTNNSAYFQKFDSNSNLHYIQYQINMTSPSGHGSR